MVLTIGEMARKADVPASTLRYYEREGLLPFVGRSCGGARMFNEADMQWLEIITCMKKTGMSVKEIRQFVDWCIEGDSSICDRLELIKAQKKEVERQIAEMNEHLSMLEYKTWYYEKAEEAGTCDVHKALKREDVPQKFLRYV